HGFRFIGPTVAYAFMQAVGMVNDHEVTCFRHKQLAGGRRQNSGVRSQELAAGERCAARCDSSAQPARP
ncbi:MAG: DNA-3-methyladenine glycosylase I, partial [Verrucomicrobia bacterium]|nr:DNA-3-methyladenine glycosylase I [Verrucomicrobiota bacterium]